VTLVRQHCCGQGMVAQGAAAVAHGVEARAWRSAGSGAAWAAAEREHERRRRTVRS